MTVYVDVSRSRFGRMIMCHMRADTDNELDEFAARIGLLQKWKHRDHYDVCLSKRALAISKGAVAITNRGMVELRRKNKHAD